LAAPAADYFFVMESDPTDAAVQSALHGGGGAVKHTGREMEHSNPLTTPKAGDETPYSFAPVKDSFFFEYANPSNLLHSL